MRKLLLILSLAAFAAAQTPALTTVTDSLFATSVSLKITAASGFTTSDGYEIPPGYTVSSTSSTGNISISLPPNAGSSPAGTYYIASYQTPARNWTEIWIVPASASPVRLAAVRAQTPPPQSYMLAFAQINAPANCIAQGGIIEDADAGWSCTTVLTSPMTTPGDLIVGGASGAPARLAAGANGDVLTSNGPAEAPSWQPSAGGGGMVYPDAGIADSTGAAWGTSFGVGTAAGDIPQLDGSGKLLAAIFPILNQDTSGTAAKATACATVDGCWPKNGAYGTPTSLGLANASGLPIGGIAATGTPSTTTYLRGDGSWSTPGGGSTTLPVVMPETYGAKDDGAYYFDGTITPATNAQSGTSATPTTPAIATAIDGSVVDYAWQTNAAWSAAPAAGTQQIAVAYAGAGTYGLTVDDRAIATAAPVATANGTTSSSQLWNAAAIVLTPSATISVVGAPTSAKIATGDVMMDVPIGAVEGDMLVGAVAHYGAGITWPAGWTLLFTGSDAGGDRLDMGYIVLGASPPSSYTWGNTGGGISAGVIAYRNVRGAYALSTLSSATAAFTSTAVGDPICTAGTASDGKGEQCGMIAGYISATEAFVDYVAKTEPDDIWFGYGADDSPAFSAMLTSAPCSTIGCKVQLGPYGYALTNSYTLAPNITIQMQGAGAGVPNTTNSFINGNTPPNANTGSRLMFLATGLTKAAITIGGTPEVTSVAAWDRLADLSLIAGAGRDQDGGGADGVDVLNWQDASLDRVLVANFAGKGVYVDGMTAGSNKEYIGVIGLDQLYTIWNGGPGRQIGSSTAVNNLETISDNYGISEGNGGPAVKLEGNIQGYVHIGNIDQWNNTVSPDGASEIEIDNSFAGGCEIRGNYFEVDDGDAHPITPGRAGCNVSNYIAGNDDNQSAHTGVNTTAPVNTLTIGGGISSTPYVIGYSTTPALDAVASAVQQFTCTTAGASLTPTIANLTPGAMFTVIFVQNGTTACTWAWPSTVHGGGTVTTTLGGVSTQQFVASKSGTDAYATSQMQSTTGGTP